MQAKGIPVTYMLFPDEGHGFARPENNTAFNAVTEGFLATCLGGRAEPIGDDFAGSSATVPVGADAVPGLVEVMKSHEPEIRNRSEEHTSELPSLMRISYAVFCLKKKKK